MNNLHNEYKYWKFSKYLCYLNVAVFPDNAWLFYLFALCLQIFVYSRECSLMHLSLTNIKFSCTWRQILLEDYHLMEKQANIDRERIPKYVVHARRTSSKGFFEVTDDIPRLTCSCVDFLWKPQSWDTCYCSVLHYHQWVWKTWNSQGSQRLCS